MATGTYRPPRVPRYRPTGPLKSATVKAMNKTAADLKDRHPDLGAAEHVSDAARALGRNQHEAAQRHLRAAMENMTPTNLRRHGLLTDDQHDQAKRSMDVVHRHMLQVKDVQDLHEQNQQLPHSSDNEDLTDEAPPSWPDDDVKPSTRPGNGAAVNAPKTTSIGRIDINVTKPQQMTKPKSADQVAASNADLAQRVIDLVGPKGYSHGWVFHGKPGGDKGSPLNVVSREAGAFNWGGHMDDQHPGIEHTEHAHIMDHVAMAGAQTHTHPFLARLGQAVHSAAEDNPYKLNASVISQFSNAGLAARVIELVGPHGYVHGWIKVGPGEVTDSQAAAYHGTEVRGALLGERGVKVGRYNHHAKTVTDHNGVTHKVRAIDPTAQEAGFKGDVASSHLPADIKQALTGYNREYRAGAVTKRISMEAARQRMIQFSAETARLAVTPAPRGKPGGPGLYDVKGNEHSAYLQQVVKALIEKRGMKPGTAYAIARAQIRKWGARSKHPEVRAAATGAEAQEIAAQARAHAHANISACVIDLVGPHGYVHGWIKVGVPRTREALEEHMTNYHGGNPVAGHQIGPRKMTAAQVRARHEEMHRLGQIGAGHYHDATIQTANQALARQVIELVGTAAGAAKDTHVPAGSPQGGQFGSGGGASSGKAAKGKTSPGSSRAARKAALLKQAAGLRAQAFALMKRLAVLRKARASAAGKISKGQVGSKTKTTATTKTNAPAASPAAKQAAAQVSQMSKAAAQAVTPAQVAQVRKTMNAKQISQQITALSKQITVLMAKAAVLTAQAAKL